MRLPRFATLLLLPALSAFPQSRLWEANLVDPAELLPAGFPRAPDTSLIPSPEAGFHAALASEAEWRGAVKREGGTRSRHEILSAGTVSTLWVAPIPEAAVGLSWTG